MTNENKKTSDQLIFVHIFRKKHFKTNLENFMSESLNATSTPLKTLTSADSYFIFTFKKSFHVKISVRIEIRKNVFMIGSEENL